MAREQIEFYSASTSGRGFEGFLNWTNSIVDFWMIPAFLLVFYLLTIYVLSKSEYKNGGNILFASILFFILSMIAQTFTQFNQIVIFFFGIMIGVGAVITFIESARQ